MHRRKRIPMNSLREADIPKLLGVYALYRKDKPMYVGKAKSLQSRVWKNHSGRGVSMGDSAMRRNVAEYLGIANAKDIKDGLRSVTEDEAKRRRWLDGCEITYSLCALARRYNRPSRRRSVAASGNCRRVLSEYKTMSAAPTRKIAPME